MKHSHTVLWRREGRWQEKRNSKLLGLCVDGASRRVAWLRTIKERIEHKGMKNVEVHFPVISDLTTEVSTKFGMLQPAPPRRLGRNTRVAFCRGGACAAPGSRGANDSGRHRRRPYRRQPGSATHKLNQVGEA